MLLAAGQPPKVLSETLGHRTVSFTMDAYASAAEELAEGRGGRHRRVHPPAVPRVPTGGPDYH
jgi:hypothetical protein